MVHQTGSPLLDEQYIILPAASASILVLILVSLATPADPEKKWKEFYTKDASLADAMKETETL
jgi:solute:Na+ symporter, SSS family